MGQFAAEVLGCFLRAEVFAGRAPIGDGVGDAVNKV